MTSNRIALINPFASTYLTIYGWSLVYAILDTNTCPPCESADGLIAVTPSDLPDAPKPDCEGGASCRCFVVGVIV